MIFEASPTEFYLVGNFHLKLVYKSSPARNVYTKQFPITDFESVHEGYFDDNGEFIVVNERNGDEVMFGDFWAAPHSRVTRVKLVDTGV